MKSTTEKTEKPAAAPLMVWRVAKTPEGGTLKIGQVRCGVGAEVRLSKEQADKLNEALPGCLEFQGL